MSEEAKEPAPRKRPEPRALKVLESGAVTKNMFRVTLGGAGLDGFPPEQAGGYVKLMIPPSENGRGKRGGEGARPVVRTYTIRHHHDDAIDIDFALHGEQKAGGPATAWAVTADPGHVLRVGGPGAAKPLPDRSGCFLLVGDLTALPAISVNLESLGPDARGHAVIEIQDDADRQELDVPPGVEMRWLVNPEPGSRPELLADYVRALPWPDDITYAWAASEFEAMRRLRTYLREERGLGPDRLYISSYWKRGLVEDEHRGVKREDAEGQRA